MNYYFDHWNNQWVGEYNVKGPNGDIGRQTEWFDSESDAKHFSRTGEYPA